MLIHSKILVCSGAILKRVFYFRPIVVSGASLRQQQKRCVYFVSDGVSKIDIITSYIRFRNSMNRLAPVSIAISYSAARTVS